MSRMLKVFWTGTVCGQRNLQPLFCRLAPPMGMLKNVCLFVVTDTKTTRSSSVYEITRKYFIMLNSTKICPTRNDFAKGIGFTRAFHYTLCIANWMSSVIGCNRIHQSIVGCQGFYANHRHYRESSLCNECFGWVWFSKQIFFFDDSTSRVI